MPPGIGYSFSPGEGDINFQQNGQGGPGAISPTEAVKILSLRIPQRRSDPSPIPLPLLQAGGGAGGFGGGLNAFLQALMGAFSAPPGGGGGAPVSVSGPPSVQPGGGGAAPLPGFVVPNQPEQPQGSGPFPGGRHQGFGGGRHEGAPNPLFNQPLF